MKHLDLTGREIQIGNIITYAVRVGNSAELKMGRVVELKVSKSAYENLVPKIKIQSVGLGWSGEVQKAEKLTTIERLENVFILAEGGQLLPQKWFDLLTN